MRSDLKKIFKFKHIFVIMTWTRVQLCDKLEQKYILYFSKSPLQRWNH